MLGMCFCGCGERAVQLHHVIERKALRVASGKDRKSYLRLEADKRNLVPVAKTCHDNHSNRANTYRLERLPDAVFDFAVETLGEGKAYNLLRRTHAGEDGRLGLLIGDD